jgi:hypothetical protein
MSMQDQHLLAHSDQSRIAVCGPNCQMPSYSPLEQVQAFPTSVLIFFLEHFAHKLPLTP